MAPARTAYAKKKVRENSSCSTSDYSSIYNDEWINEVVNYPFDALPYDDQGTQGKIDFNDLPDEISGVKLEDREYIVPTHEEWQKTRNRYHHVREKWMKHLAQNHRSDLLANGIKPAQIEQMKRGLTPKGWQTHHIVPTHGSGTNDFANLVFVKKAFHLRSHRIIDPQVCDMKIGEKRMVKILAFKTPIFNPDRPKDKAKSLQKPNKARQIKLNFANNNNKGR